MCFPDELVPKVCHPERWIGSAQKNEDELRGGVFLGTHIKKITIPTSVKELGAKSFKDCKELRHVVFRAGILLEEIGDLCFAGSGIREVTIPNCVTAICSGAFSFCRDLR